MDPKNFSNSLMRGVKEQLEGSDRERDPVVLMDRAYRVTLERVAQGSSTCILGSLSADGVLKTANMGDSALVVIRAGVCVHETEDMQYSFNAPYQLTTQPQSGYMMPANSKTTEFQVILAAPRRVCTVWTKNPHLSKLAFKWCLGCFFAPSSYERSVAGAKS